MTISYSGNFGKLLVRWKGSIWKSVWKELLIFLILYYAIRLLYHYVMTESQQELFQCAILRFEFYTRYIPLTFLLGFYIAAIIKRWWDQFQLIAWPDDVLSLVCIIVSGSDEKSKLVRHVVARYLNLAAAMAWRDVSKRVWKRFPSLDHLVASGLMTEEEKELCDSILGETNVTNGKWFLPLEWAQKIVQDMITERKIAPPLTSAFYNQFCAYRACFRQLLCYDWVCIPLVYTQVAALATYGYFGFCLIGHQFLKISENQEANIHKMYKVDMYVPVCTILQFLFFVGWFKVGQDLMRPFGTDDDDFELNFILDRHIQTSFSLADQVSLQEPLVLPDRFWNPSPPPNAAYILPHTKVSSKIKEHVPHFRGGSFKLKHKEEGELIFPIANVQEIKENLLSNVTEMTTKETQ